MTMKFQHSLQKRIVLNFCLFAAVIGVVFASAVYVSLDYVDDYLIDSRLEQEIAYLGSVYKNTTDALVPKSRNIKVYKGTTAMPPHTIKMVAGIGEGIHEKYYDGIEYHVAVKTIPGRIVPLYLIFDVSTLEFTETRKIRIGIVLVVGIVMVLCLGFWIAVLLSRKIIAPIAHLADQVKRLEPGNLPVNLSESFTNDEVGVLARSLEQAVQRIESFVMRERQFTRDASHELRTPVTIIKGAVEIIEKQMSSDPTPNMLRPLRRIRRAVTDMENLIETFLWLGREDVFEHFEETCEVVPTVEKVIEQMRQLFVDKPVEIELNAEEEPVLTVPPPLFQAVIANLVMNAFQSTREGKIIISVCHDRIAISDTGDGIAACDLPAITEAWVRGDNSHGFGLGLAIVEKVCRRFGWHFEIESDDMSGAAAYLYFQTNQDPNNSLR